MAKNKEKPVEFVMVFPATTRAEAEETKDFLEQSGISPVVVEEADGVFEVKVPKDLVAEAEAILADDVAYEPEFPDEESDPDELEKD